MISLYLTPVFQSPQFTRPKTTSPLPFKTMSWACSKCTFVNPPSQKSTCKVCSSSTSTSTSTSASLPPSPSPSSSSPPRWSCKSCTFLNRYGTVSCEICGTRASVSSLSSFDDLDSIGHDDELGSSVGSVFLPLQRFKSKIEISQEIVVSSTDSIEPTGFRGSKRKMEDTVEISKDSIEPAGFRGIKSANKGVAVLESTDSSKVLRPLKIMTYNVWFQESLEIHRRMKAISDLIQLHSPDIICFQEVTPNIYDIFKNYSWWKLYRCSVSSEEIDSLAYFVIQLSKLPVKSFSARLFSNTKMGRELCVAETHVQADKQLLVATSHLESPCPGPPTWDQMFSKERVHEANEAISFLKKYPNAIFCGDMNWSEKLDGEFPLAEGWFDAWKELKPGEDGYTYDTKANKMLSGNRSLRKRLDRFVCGLRDFKVSQIEMIGMEAIPGLSYIKEKKVKTEIKKLELPVYPSDHFGLVLTIVSK